MKMGICWLPANQAFVLVFVDSIIDLKGRRFFGTRKELLGEMGFDSMAEFNACLNQ